MRAILFLAAGDWRWLQGWVFLGELGFFSFAVSLWLLRYHPALLESRLSAPVRRDQMPWDRIFMLAVAVVFIGWMVLIALDVRRFGWSHVPLWAQALGAVLIALGMVLVWQTFPFNTFAAPQVRVQAARAHQVVTDGPYRIVRHPMYVGGMLWLLGMPLLLGSWWGVLRFRSWSPAWRCGPSARSVCCAASSPATTSTQDGSGSGCFRASGERRTSLAHENLPSSPSVPPRRTAAIGFTNQHDRFSLGGKFAGPRPW
jgi:protein-S-isoprenylcysteine O-methyltransferase Ste14